MKLREFSLLLLRAAILCALALLLAQTVWVKNEKMPARQAQSWVLVSPEIMQQSSDRRVFRTIDSLVTSGFQLRLFASGFSEITPVDSVSRSQKNENYWSLLREIDMLGPSVSHLWIITPDRLAGVRGERPLINAEVNWQIIPPQGQNQWVAEVLPAPQDSLSIFIGFSEATKTTYRNYVQPIPKQRTALAEDGMPAMEIIPDLNGLDYDLRLLASDAMPEDNLYHYIHSNEKSILTIMYDEQHREDAEYVHLAAEAALEVASLPVAIEMHTADKKMQLNEKTRWAFWLANQSLPESLLAQRDRGLTLITAADSTQYQLISSRIVMANSDEHVQPRLWRRTLAAGKGASLWADGFGEPVLEYQPKGLGELYRFHTRFHPMWNALVLNAAFPKWIMDLLSYNKTPAPWRVAVNRLSDIRRIGEGQLEPAKAPRMQKSEPAQIPLRMPLWIVTLILFAIERWASDRNLKNTNENQQR